MRVIDGMHRLRAAILNGRSSIEVEFFDGSDEEAFIRAVEQNVSAWPAADLGRPQGMPPPGY